MLPERRYRARRQRAVRSASASPATARSTGRTSSPRSNEIGYDGGVAIEHEDDVYGWHDPARYDEGLVRGWQVLTR